MCLCVFKVWASVIESVRVGVGKEEQACACARVALIIQHATSRHIVTCNLSGSNIFLDIIS
jgi:hypothetical protein